MAIQMRRGVYSNYDPSKMVAGEIAVVQSGDPNGSNGQAAYIAFQPGQVKRLATNEDIHNEISAATEDIVDQIEEGVADDVQAAQTAATTATTKASEASASAAQAAQTVANIIDNTLTQTGKAADAKKVGDEITDLKSDLNRQYIVDDSFNKPEVVRAYYIDPGTGVATSNSKYAITRLFEQGYNVAVNIPGNTYEFAISMYGSNGDISDGTGYIGRQFDGYKSQLVILPNDVPKIAITIRRKDGANIGSSEGTTIRSALVFYRITDGSLSVPGLPPDAKETGRINNLLISLHNNVELDVSSVGTSTYPTGWRSGRWNDSGSVASDTTSICMVGRIGIPGGNNQRKGAKGIYVATTFGIIEIKRYRSGTLIETISNASGKAYCAGNDGELLSVSITGLISPSSDYISGGDIANIHVYIMFPDEPKAGYVDSEYFTVPINTTWIDGNADSVNTENVDCVLRLPVSYSPGGTPVRLIFMHHGNSGTVNVQNQTWYSEANSWKNFVNSYLAAGYAVFDVNGCGPVTDADASHDYGAFGALQAAFKAYKYITDKYNINKRIFVHGSSMGGATAYAFVKAYGGIVDAVGLFSPALLSRSAQMDAVDDYIAVNYGYADATAMVADNYSHLIPANPCIEYYDDGAKIEKPYTYDWVNNHESDGLNLICKDFSIPMKIWCGTADTSVDPKYGDELSKAITKAGGLAIFRSVANGTHSISVGSDSTVNSEAVMWFDRFR